MEYPACRLEPAGSGAVLWKFDPQQLLGLSLRQLCAAARGGRL